MSQKKAFLNWFKKHWWRILIFLLVVVVVWQSQAILSYFARPPVTGEPAKVEGSEVHTERFLAAIEACGDRLESADAITGEVICREKVEVAPVPTETTAPTPTPEPMATEEPVSEEVVAEGIQFDEPLQMTLDEFGSKVFYDDRFPRDGQIWDQSYWEGWILVLNAYAIHDHDFVSQKGCVVAYYQAPAEGERVRFTGWDGMAFELAPDSGITLNQAIATMRETLIRAHGCDPEAIQYHELFRHGDPVK